MARVGKRLCVERESCEPSGIESLKKVFESRFAALESKIDLVLTTVSTILVQCENSLEENKKEHSPCLKELLPKIELLEEIIKKFCENRMLADKDSKDGENGKRIVLVPPNGDNVNEEEGIKKQAGDIEIITLNSEEDLPNGSWLGDETKPEARVRVNIPPSIMIHINEQCTTPEKMALTLMDILFSRDIQAVSNLSGKGKHCKKRLDPLLVYGIRCHLVYKFNISAQDWHRIKQNIDSKCRSSWRKKFGSNGTKRVTSSGASGPSIVSEDSSDGSQVLNMVSSFHFMCPDSGAKKSLSDTNDRKLNGRKKITLIKDEFTELLPSSVELFSIEDSDYFGLRDHTKFITEEVCDEDDQLSPKT